MMTHTENCHAYPAARTLRTVALIGRYAHQHMHDVTRRLDCGVILVESAAHAYSNIKRMRPDLVVMCLSDHDVEGCSVLSMLALDGETSRIPVLTYLTPSTDSNSDAADLGSDTLHDLCAGSVN
jgi:CheY-like chemotaxis protein